MNPLRDAQANLPLYVRDYSRGLLAAIISDPTVTSLFLGAFTRQRSVRRFFLGYAAARSINSVANAVGYGLRAVASKQ